MAAPGAGTSLIFSLSCLLGHHALGTALRAVGSLPPPQNVNLSSKNFSLFLTWVPAEHSPEIFYLAGRGRVWRRAPNCSDPSGEGCDLTCTIESCYEDYLVKVGSRGPGPSTNWSLSRYFNPFQDIDLGAPQLKVDLKEQSVLVHLKVKLAVCKEKVLGACLLDNLSYDVKFWNADERVTKPIEQSTAEKVMEIQKTQLYGSNICVSARSVYKNTYKKSNFSEPLCLSFEAKGAHLLMAVIVVGSLLACVLGIFIVIPLAVTKMRDITSVPSGLKMPEALDFINKISFIQMEYYQPVDCSLLNVIRCNASGETIEEKAARERTVAGEDIATRAMGGLDSSSESEGDLECLDYTENRWIPDGMIFGRDDDRLDDHFYQRANTDPYRKTDCSSMSIHAALDIQRQGSGCSDHPAPQTKSCSDVASPYSVNSELLNCSDLHDSINVLEPSDQGSDDDIPLTSVKLLTCNGEIDDGDDLLPYNPPVPDHDLNSRDKVAWEIGSNPTCLYGM
ncbi:interleukin-10 receptor subunit beta-like isoform X2 [Rhinoraja longicauda]